MAKVHSIHDAQAQLSRLIERACAGEDIVIARGKTPVVRLVPIDFEAPARKYGAMKGRSRVSDAFFESLPEDESTAWGQ